MGKYVGGGEGAEMQGFGEFIGESRKNRKPSEKNQRGFKNFMGWTKSWFAKHDAYYGGEATDLLRDRNVPKRLRGGRNPYPKGVRHDEYERGKAPWKKGK